MINYAHIKQSVTTRQAAESYGIHVDSHGMAICPFHDDRRPSMKVDETFILGRRSLWNGQTAMP